MDLAHNERQLAVRVLVACEFSGVVRQAFKRRGHNVMSVDLLPAEDGEFWDHCQTDIIEYLKRDIKFDLMIAHPPCTYLCTSGLHWNCRTPGRYLETRKAIEFVERIWDANIPRIAIENPIGCLPTHSKLMKASQTIQPYEYGEDASKATCLWLKNLPLLKPTKFIEPRMVGGKKLWSNQTDSGQNKLTPSETRSMERSRTYYGIAEAMAEQWGAV